MDGIRMDSFSRRTFLKLTSFTLADVFSLPVIVLGEDGRKPNVVIMFTDDQGTLDANCYGSKDLYTPTMDKLAETGVRFTQAYAHTVCCPAQGADADWSAPSEVRSQYVDAGENDWNR